MAVPARPFRWAVWGLTCGLAAAASGCADGDAPAVDAALMADASAADVAQPLADGPVDLPQAGDASSADGAEELPEQPPVVTMLGTPNVTDVGAGHARSGAGFYRLAVQAWAPGLSFRHDRRTVVDFYYSSELEVVSTGLGGKLMRLPSSSTAAVYGLPFGDALQLVLDHAQSVPHTFMTAVLKERGPRSGETELFPYLGVVNKIANAPYAGGPSTAPAGPFTPPFFKLAHGLYVLKCTGKSVPMGTDDTWTPEQTYALSIDADGTVKMGTNAGTFERRWSEAFDTHVWPTDANQTEIKLIDGRGKRITVLTWDPLADDLGPITQLISHDGTFASYTLVPQ